MGEMPKAEKIENSRTQITTTEGQISETAHPGRHANTAEETTTIQKTARLASIAEGSDISEASAAANHPTI